MADTLENWKKISLSQNVDDIRRDALKGDASISNFSNWKFGQTKGPTWNRFADNVIPKPNNKRVDDFISSLDFRR